MTSSASDISVEELCLIFLYSAASVLLDFEVWFLLALLDSTTAFYMTVELHFDCFKLKICIQIF